MSDLDGNPVCIPVSSVAAAGSNGHYVAAAGCLRASGLSTGYGKVTILRELSLTLRPGAVTAIVGPNASGKSTLLRTMARLLSPSRGDVMLGDRNVHRGSRRELAQQMAVLTQGPTPPSGFLVEDLIAEGRRPHQSLLRQWTDRDEAAVESALLRTGLTDLRYREVETLSGGQRQRAWAGMALAQDTPVLLLDEPTTFLDIAHQLEFLDLVRALNRGAGKTVVMILHDLNMAARYADDIVAMKDGAVFGQGTPAQLITAELMREVFGIECSVVLDERSGAPLVLPSRVACAPSSGVPS